MRARTMNPLRTGPEASAKNELPRAGVPRSGGLAAHHSLLFPDGKKGRPSWIFWAVIVLAVMTIASLVMFTEFDWTRVNELIDGLNPVLVISLMAVLPVAGFPISVVYLMAGARFGPAGGGVVVAGVTAAHLLLTHAVTRTLLRGPIERFVERRHRRLPNIPPEEHAAVALIAGLAPGLPYVVRNYLLALSGVRLRIYFWICLPVYVARSYVSILLGDLTSEPSGKRLGILVTIDVVKVAICALVIWRLRVRHRRRGVAEADAGAGGGERISPLPGGN